MHPLPGDKLMAMQHADPCLSRVLHFVERRDESMLMSHLMLCASSDTGKNSQSSQVCCIMSQKTLLQREKPSSMLCPLRSERRFSTVYTIKLAIKAKNACSTRLGKGSTDIGWRVTSRSMCNAVATVCSASLLNLKQVLHLRVL